MRTLIERLKNPEDHYEFSDPKKANAVLMSLCQEAADALADIKQDLIPVQEPKETDFSRALRLYDKAVDRLSLAAQPAPVQAPLSFNCSAGCGACGVKLQDFVTHQTQAQEGDDWVVVDTEPQIVSTCCGSPVEVWDERKQDITAGVDTTPPAQPAPVQPVANAKAIAECLAVLRPAVKGRFPHEQALEELVGYTTTTPAQPAVPEGWKLVPVDALTRWRAAFAEELSAWDIDPPLHHVKTSHDEIDAVLAAAPEKGQP